MPLRRALIVGVVALAACRPPAADEYTQRTELSERESEARVVMEDPDTSAAIWAPSARENRLLFGTPGAPPLLALACEDGGTRQARIALTRYVAADPQASALIAIIGNSHIARLPVETRWNGRAWLWTGNWDACAPELAVFTGNRAIDATIPGAGTIAMEGSTLPGELVSSCAPAEPIDPPA